VSIANQVLEYTHVLMRATMTVQIKERNLEITQNETIQLAIITAAFQTSCWMWQNYTLFSWRIHAMSKLII